MLFLCFCVSESQCRCASVSDSLSLSLCVSESTHPHTQGRQRDKERGKRDTPRTGKSPTQQNTGGKRKKNNKLTRSDQKRGKKDKEKVRGSYNRTKRQEGSTQEYSGFGEYVKNTGDRRKKKNKLTRSDKKRP